MFFSNYYSDKELRRELKSMKRAAKQIIKEGKARQFVEEIHKAIGLPEDYFKSKAGNEVDKKTGSV